MDRSSDEGYETVELGRGAVPDDDGAAAPALPPLALDQQVGGPGSPPPDVSNPPGPAWRRWATMAAVFAFGLIAGASVWDARSDTVDLATEASEVKLVAGSVLPEPTTPGEGRWAVRLHNAGARDVTVLALHPTGWDTNDEPVQAQATTVPAAGWADVVATFSQNCNAPVPEQLDARVRTEAGEQQAAIALPPGAGILAWILEAECSGLAARTVIEFDRSVLVDAYESGTLRMVVTARVQPRAEVDITAVSASDAGFRAATKGLPVSIEAGAESSVPFELEWQIDDCARTHELGELAVEFETRTSDGTPSVAAPLPHRAIALLGRFAAEECDA